MAKRITVTAIKPLHYEGRSHVPGAVFTTTPVDAASLKYRGVVKLGGQLSGGTVQEHPSITRRMEPVKGFAPPAKTPVAPEPPMPTNEAPVEQVPPTEAPGGDQPDASTPAARGRRGRGYQRRDMIAEPPTGTSAE